MKSTYIDIAPIGKVLFENSKRAKHINISVKPKNLVRVAVPRRVSFKRAAEFVHQKVEWIRKKLKEYEAIERDHRDLSTNGISIDREQAKEQLISRLDVLAHEHGFSYNRVFIRNQKTRWGSCSAKNNINLNCKLVLLPQHLQDHVILHELVHTRHKDHSPRFWKELERIDPDTPANNRELKNYHISLL